MGGESEEGEGREEWLVEGRSKAKEKVRQFEIGEVSLGSGKRV